MGVIDVRNRTPEDIFSARAELPVWMDATFPDHCNPDIERGPLEDKPPVHTAPVPRFTYGHSFEYGALTGWGLDVMVSCLLPGRATTTGLRLKVVAPGTRT